MTSLDGINGPLIQTLLRGENDSKQSDEFQATCAPEFVEKKATKKTTPVRSLPSVVYNNSQRVARQRKGGFSHIAAVMSLPTVTF